MKFVEPKVVDSLSEDGLLLAQDGEDVVKVPVSKLILPSDGNEDDNTGVIYIDSNADYSGDTEFGNKLYEAINNGITVYVENAGMNGNAISIPLFYSLKESYSTGRTDYYIQICYYGYLGSGAGNRFIDIPYTPPQD